MQKTFKATGWQPLVIILTVELCVFCVFRLPLEPWTGKLVDGRRSIGINLRNDDDEGCGPDCNSNEFFSDASLGGAQNDPFENIPNVGQRNDGDRLLEVNKGSSNKTLVLKPQGGLGEWLQIVASAATISKNEQLALKIVAGAGFGSEIVWNDLFLNPKVQQSTSHRRLQALSVEGQPLKGGCMHLRSANWNDVAAAWETVHQGQKELCLETRQLAKDDGDGGDWRSETSWFYKMLSPVPAIQQNVAQFKTDVQWSKYEWVGVHIEGAAARAPRDKADIATDGDADADADHPLQIKLRDSESTVPLSDYISQMKRMLQTMPNHDLEYWQAIKPVRFFLVTKSGSVRRAVHAAFRPGMVVDASPDQLQSHRERLNPKQVDAMSLLLLASCRAMIGTPFSPYSNAANLMGESFYVEPRIRNAVDWGV